MKFQHASIAALAGAAAAQNAPNLTAALAGTPELSQLTTFLGQFPDVVGALSNATNITLLAPSNQALAALLASPAASSLTDMNLVRAVLSYHVLNGTTFASGITNKTAFIPTMLNNMMYSNVTGGQRVAAAMVDGKATFFSGGLHKSVVTVADRNFTGGTIHVIDSFLSVPMNVSSTAVAANLTSLAGALGAAKVSLDGARDLTIFAPSNAAFKAVGSVFSGLSAEETQRLLAYHVVNGTVGYSAGLANGTVLQTLAGGNVTVYVRNGTVFVNNARVITTDVLVANGVVHVIDNLLNPNNTAATADPSATTGAGAFPSATGTNEEPFTSGVPQPTGPIATNSGPPVAAPTTSTGAAMPMQTAAIGQALLFGGVAAAMMNL